MSGLGQSLGAALGQFAFGANSGDSRMKGRLDGIKAGLMDAQTSETLAQQLKVEAERRMLEQQEQARTPEALLRNAITQYAIPEDDTQAVEQFRKTGQLGGRYAPAADGMGPVTPQPEWAKNLPALSRTLANTQRALTLGDKSVKSVAEADLIGRESAIGDDIIAGRVDPLKVSQSQFALKGSAPFSFQEYGTGNNLTGALNEETGAAARFGQKRIAETKAEQARAAASYASASSSNASAAKTNEERKQGKWQYDSARGGRVNVQTGEFEPIVQDGKPIGSAAAGRRPMTAAQEANYREELAKDYQAANTNLANMNEVLNSITAVREAPGLDGATGAMAYLPSIPGGKAAEAEVRLKNLEGKITQLGKAAAAQGGAIGPMAVQEWKIVRDMIAAIDPGKGKQAMLDQIDLIEGSVMGATERIKDVYEKQYSPDFEAYPQFQELKVPKRDITPKKDPKAATPRGSPRPAVVPDGPYSDAEKERRYQEFKDRQKP